MFDIEKFRINFKRLAKNEIHVYGHKRNGIFYAVVYRWLDKPDGNSICFEQPFRVVSTSCNFGGQRYWFECLQCERRVGVLYLNNGYMACRLCHDLTYASKNAGRSWEITYLRRIIILQKRLEKLKPQVKRSFYGGNITAKQKRYSYLYLKWRFANGFV
jgi:hypothetical protein